MNARTFLKSFLACARAMAGLEARSLFGQTFERIEEKYDLDQTIELALVKRAFLDGMEVIHRATGLVVVELAFKEHPSGGNVARALIMLTRDGCKHRPQAVLPVETVLISFLKRLLNGAEPEQVCEHAETCQDKVDAEERFLCFYILFDHLMDDDELRPILLEAMARNAGDAMFFARLKDILPNSLLEHRGVDAKHLHHALKRAETTTQTTVPTPLFGAQKRGSA